MPVIIREGSWRIWIWTRDHGLPHVHVYHGGGAVKILLPTRRLPAMVTARQRMPDREVAAALRLVERHKDELISAWRAIHGLPKPD
ncbi:DUF4160 domain-containing protein [Longimicrobium sp.]|jgi:hypothetical protein|uniref:DUF4160 domain-containing protein n=1 Tax=Longimicrobium sp. TaxID=2029185 RepID=UPI002F91E05E